MADIKISALPAFVGTVAGAALLALVSGGTTYRATVADIISGGIALDGGTLSKSASGLKVAVGGVTGTELAVGAVDLATNKVTGTLPVAKGGTGLAALGSALQVLRTNAAANATEWASISALASGSAGGQALIWDGANWAGGALDLADADARTGLLPHANIANGSALSVFGRAGNTAGVMASIVGTDGQALRVSGTALGFGTLATAAYADASVTLAKLANGSASSVLGRSAATGGVYADIASSADGQVLRRGASGVLAWGAVDLADADAVTGLLPWANLATIATDRLLGRDTAGTGALEALTVGGGLAFSGAGGIQFATAVLPIATLGGALQSIRVNAGATALEYYTPGSGAPTGTAVGQTQTWNGSTWIAGALDLADADAVTGLLPHANIANGAALSVFGRASNTAGVMAAIVGADGQALRVSGTALGFGTLATAAYADASVTLAKLANGTASSILGRSAATGGAYADIASSADGQVLRRGASGVIGFGAVDLADADAVTGVLPHANLATLAALSVFGRSANTSGALAAITATTVGQVLGYQGTALGWDTRIGDTFTMLEVANLATNREIVSFCLGADLTTTQMPAGTGDKVGFWALATTAPTANPVGGHILYATATGFCTRAPDGIMGLGDQVVTQIILEANSSSGIIALAAASISLGQAGSFVSVSSAGVELKTNSVTMIQAATLATNREIVSLCLGAAVSATQMPALTGDRVIYIGDATTAPTTGLTSRAVGGGIVFSDATYGLIGRSNYTETTLVPKSGGGSATRKLSSVVVTNDVTVSGASTPVVVSFDGTSLLGSTMAAGCIVVRATYVVYSGGSAYNDGGELVALVSLDNSGVPTVIQSTGGYTTANGRFTSSGAEAPTNAVIAVTGNAVQLQVTMPAVGSTRKLYGRMEITGMTG